VLALWPVERGWAQTAQALVGRAIEARVVRVADGDTLEIVPSGERAPIRVRLEGVDAPELGEVFSREAHAFLRGLLFDQTVRVRGRDVDRYGRLVARVELGGRDASRALLEAGLACQRFAVDAALASAESTARAAGRGFWSAVRKPQCVQRAAADRRVSAAPRARPSSPASASNAALVRGNVVSRVYHRSSCPNYRCRNCTREFASEADARAAGFLAAGDCLK
jgi:endonuclease YncB( thermonuclease family)